MTAATGAGWADRPITSTDAAGWVAKAASRAVPLLELAGPVADPAPVAPSVTAAADAPYGNLMVAWLEPEPAVRLVRHLPDAGFFLTLLRQVYGPVLERRPELAAALADDSRCEVALTNDVLQIQLRALPEGYSMVRHHALMLFAATLWLDEPRRGRWLALYDALVDQLDGVGRPDPPALARIEATAFADFARLAGRTLTRADAVALLADPDELRAVAEYQLCAAAAVGLLWRDYREVPGSERNAWWAASLSRGYVDPAYLEDVWTERR